MKSNWQAMAYRASAEPWCRGAVIVIVALCWGLVPAGAAAQADMTVRSTVVDLTHGLDVRQKDGQILLTLEEVIAVTLERNLGLQVERYNLEESRFRIQFNQGIFDTTLTGLAASSEENSPAASNLAGAAVTSTTSDSLNFGVDQLTKYGGTLMATWNNNRFETNSNFATLNPSFRVDLDVKYTQPLLRDFGEAVTKRGIRIARTNEQISNQNFLLQVDAAVQSAEDAYWLLVEAREQAVVAEESLRLAKELHEQNRIKVEVGTLAPLELVQSEAGVATREEELIRARALIGDREDLLRQVMNVPPGPMWGVEVVPETVPEMEPVAIDLERFMQVALTERPDLRASRLGLDNLAVDQEYRRNQLKPRLDLDVTYGFNGLGGDVTERDFFTGEILFEAPGSYNDALNQVTRGDFEGWAIALNASYPIQNRSARANKAIADVAVDRAVIRLREQELSVTTDVRRLARAVETAAQVIASASVSEHLEERNLDAEQKRYENGMSTSFQVLQIQEDLTAARSRLATAKTNYRRALAQLYQSMGTLADEAGIEVVDAGATE